MKYKSLLLIVIITSIICFSLFVFKPKPTKKEGIRDILKVQYVIAEKKPTQIIISSEGNLMPKIENYFNSEVFGKVVFISEKFYPGKSFKRGDILFKIEKKDYEEKLTNAEAELSLAELEFIKEKALSEQAAIDIEILKFKDPSSLALREPQLKKAKKRLLSAEAKYNLAKRNLNKTNFRAPYNGIILEKKISLGSVVNTQHVAKAYALGNGEIRLNLSETEKNLLKFDKIKNNLVELIHPKNKDILAYGNLDRIEKTLNSKNKLYYCIADIEKAFSEDGKLYRNQFLEAIIYGKKIESAITLPNSALRGIDTIYIINDQNRLEIKNVEIIQRNVETTIIKDNLSGERVVLSPIPFFIEGMPVDPFINK